MSFHECPCCEGRAQVSTDTLIRWQKAEQVNTPETSERCLSAGCTKPPMRAAFCEEHNTQVSEHRCRCGEVEVWAYTHSIPTIETAAGRLDICSAECKHRGIEWLALCDDEPPPTSEGVKHGNR